MSRIEFLSGSGDEGRRAAYAQRLAAVREKQSRIAADLKAVSDELNDMTTDNVERRRLNTFAKILGFISIGASIFGATGIVTISIWKRYGLKSNGAVLLPHTLGHLPLFIVTGVFALVLGSVGAVLAILDSEPRR